MLERTKIDAEMLKKLDTDKNKNMFIYPTMGKL